MYTRNVKENIMQEINMSGVQFTEPAAPHMLLSFLPGAGLCDLNCIEWMKGWELGSLNQVHPYSRGTLNPEQLPTVSLAKVPWSKTGQPAQKTPIMLCVCVCVHVYSMCV